MLCQKISNLEFTKHRPQSCKGQTGEETTILFPTGKTYGLQQIVSFCSTSGCPGKLIWCFGKLRSLKFPVIPETF
jgi:hypothetical protein